MFLSPPFSPDLCNPVPRCCKLKGEQTFSYFKTQKQIFLRLSEESSLELASITHSKWRRKWQPTPVSLPGKFHGWRSLAGCSPQGHKESDTTEQLHFTSSLTVRWKSHKHTTALEECLLGRVQTEFESQIASRNIKTDLKVGNGVPLP